MRVTVYRLETAEGRGLYDSGYARRIQQRLGVDMFNAGAGRLDGGITPELRDEGIDHANAAQGLRAQFGFEECKYGFHTLGQLCDWLQRAKALEMAQELGLVISQYEVPEDAIVVSPRQAIFAKSTATKIRELRHQDILFYTEGD